MIVSPRQACFVALAYADVFDYPLTLEECNTWMPYSAQRMRIQSEKWIQKTAQNGTEYFHLPSRVAIVKIRNNRRIEARAKWQRVRWIARWYACIPSIRMVGVTGALAMNNVSHDDDIDILFIAAKHTMWVTRFMATLLTEVFGIRRKPSDTHVANKLCLNMFLSDDNLSLPSNERDFYSAHEVLQMVPLWQRGETYRKFLGANAWVKTYLPNAWREKRSHQRSVKGIQKLFYDPIAEWFLKFFEKPAKVLQLWYMRGRMTTEIATDSIMRFHPRDARDWIKVKLRKRLQRYNIPLDKIFYAR